MTRISALRALSLKPLENGHVMGDVRLFAIGPYKPVSSRLEVSRYIHQRNGLKTLSYDKMLID